jgi:hypothetical protein
LKMSRQLALAMDTGDFTSRRSIACTPRRLKRA